VIYQILDMKYGFTMINLVDHLESPPSLKDMALRVLKNAIMSDKLKPDKIYKIEELAKSLGISKTPVREALLDLASWGFVTFLPRRGVQVNALEEKDIRDLYEFRLAMERAVMRHITPVITVGAIDRLQAINDALKSLIGSDARVEYLKKDREWHLVLAELTENDYLISALERVRDLVDWMGIKALVQRERMMEVFNEHNRVLDMLRRGDPAGAVRAMEDHILITRDRVLSQIRRVQ
jgi:DNA-binding GntR family transcriptional regulator